MKYLIVLSLLLIVGCDANAPFRNDAGQLCDHPSGECGAIIESNDKYDLGFIEFSERGNEFRLGNTKLVIDRISKYAIDPGVVVVVFIHGWKNNASAGNGNVKSFKNTLSQISLHEVIGNRKLVGVYIGWRGSSIKVKGLKEFTFWDRKAVAEEVGRRGVTSVFLDIKNAVGEENNNILLITGHSFGAAVTLSALQSLLMERMRIAEQGGKLKPFSDGVVLLNPAIEANQGLILKESSMRIGSLDNSKSEIVPTMMYVLSSRSDIPTTKYFPAGQSLGVGLTWNHAELARTYSYSQDGKDINFNYRLNESELDDTTIGNYAFFNTGRIEDKEDKHVWADTGMENLGQWRFISYCLPKDKLQRHKDNFVDKFPCTPDDPINFITVPKTFIADHNDVFNSNVNAYLISVVLKARFNNFEGDTAKRLARVPAECRKESNFDFEGCFNLYQPILAGIEQKNTQAK